MFKPFSLAIERTMLPTAGCGRDTRVFAVGPLQKRTFNHRNVLWDNRARASDGPTGRWLVAGTHVAAEVNRRISMQCLITVQDARRVRPNVSTGGFDMGASYVRT